MTIEVADSRNAPGETPASPSSPAPIPSDAEIASRVVAGDRASFEVLMRRHNARVYRTVRAMLRDESEVEDAMQQTYLLAFAHLADFNGASSFATWLTRIAANEALGRLRRRGRLVAVEDIAAAAENDAVSRRWNTPEEGATHREAVRLVEHAIDRLPVIYRAVVMLREVEQLSTAEAAEILGVTEETVRIRLHRARRTLRDAFDDELKHGSARAFPFHAPRCDRVVAAVMARVHRG